MRIETGIFSSYRLVLGHLHRVAAGTGRARRTEGTPAASAPLSGRACDRRAHRDV